jgi:hypothetical protein
MSPYQDDDFSKIYTQSIDAIYQSEMSQAKVEGEAIDHQKQGVIFVRRLLHRRLGDISGDLQEKSRLYPRTPRSFERRLFIF